MRISARSAASTELRIPVVRDRVACPRIGPGGLDRCRECAYLVSYEAAGSDGSGTASIVCSLGPDENPISTW